MAGEAWQGLVRQGTARRGATRQAWLGLARLGEAGSGRAGEASPGMARRGPDGRGRPDQGLKISDGPDNPKPSIGGRRPLGGGRLCVWLHCADLQGSIMRMLSQPAIHRSLSAAFVAVVAIAWWQYDAFQKEARAARQASRSAAKSTANLVKTITLPNGDGRLYVLQSAADDFGFDVHVCLVHVRAGANSAMACSHTAAAVPLPSD